MATVQVRLYEELNDYLPAELRKQSFGQQVGTGTTVGQLIEGLGLSMEEVELVLVDGTSVPAGYRLDDGQRVSLYPVFEGMDVGPLVRLRTHPLREPRFVVDADLPELAQGLEERGFDVIYREAYPPGELVRIARAEHRILLTADTHLPGLDRLTHVCLVQAQEPAHQLHDVMTRLDLKAAATP